MMMNKKKKKMVLMKKEEEEMMMMMMMMIYVWLVCIAPLGIYRYIHAHSCSRALARMPLYQQKHIKNP